MLENKNNTTVTSFKRYNLSCSKLEVSKYTAFTFISKETKVCFYFILVIHLKDFNRGLLTQIMQHDCFGGKQQWAMIE